MRYKTISPKHLSYISAVQYTAAIIFKFNEINTFFLTTIVGVQKRYVSQQSNV